jgi:hypothetical protein
MADGTKQELLDRPDEARYHIALVGVDTGPLASSPVMGQAKGGPGSGSISAVGFGLAGSGPAMVGAPREEVIQSWR